MTRTALAAFAAATIALAGAVPAQAQDYRFDLGINGGFSWYTDALDEDHLGRDVGDVGFEQGWLTGAQATWWIARRIGLRANFAYTERPLEFESDFDIDDLDDDEIEFDNEFDVVDDVNLWSGTGDLLFRFLGPDPRDFLGVELLPYLALGAGAKWVNPAADNVVFEIEEEDDDIELEREEGALFTIGNRRFALIEDTKFMGLLGLGSDIRLARRFGLRLEVGDRIWDAPIIALTDVGTPLLPLEGDEDVGETIHELYAQLGVHYLFGLEAPEPVAVAPAPPPPPPAPPAEEMITVCVVDPSLPGGIANVQAIYVPSTRDTLVTVNGQRVPLTTAVRDVRVATDTDWYAAGQLLTLTYDAQTAEYVTFGGARIIEPEDLAFLGTVDGVPVYADVDEVRGIQQDLERMAEGGASLEQILRQREDLRDDLEDIEVLYVTLEPIGCIFQPVRRVEEVRKTRD